SRPRFLSTSGSEVSSRSTPATGLDITTRPSGWKVSALMPSSSSNVPLKPPPQADSSRASSAIVVPVLIASSSIAVEPQLAQHDGLAVAVAGDRVTEQRGRQCGTIAAPADAGDAHARIEDDVAQAAVPVEHAARGRGVERPEVQLARVVDAHRHAFGMRPVDR